MLLKNVSFENLVAVKQDTKNYITFQPQETIEVSDEDGKWFLERYNTDMHYFEMISTPVVAVPQETQSVIPTEGVKTEKFICDICGKEAASKAGLQSHLRRHK